ncbi:MAG: carboxypeptidase regulatory-like domain-containing protein, partial [Bdellovibrionales bacterium]|nr:carboxypeptidase regulatory-like domain-containing protein [Bdellovibrionales bacterium]
YFGPDNSISPGVYQFSLRIKKGTAIIAEMPVVAAVSLDGKGGMLVHVSDIYTATLDDNLQPIPGLQGAQVKLQHETLPNLVFNGVSDSSGEVLFADIPAGSYYLRGSATKHSDEVVNVTVAPGITKTQELFLLNQIISIEWSVNEIAIEDYYEIILSAVFETKVPVAVVVLEPAGIQLPEMKQGATFLGELTLTNYGLINATGLKAKLPPSDDLVQYQFLASIPSVLKPGQIITIPYQATALKDFNPEEQVQFASFNDSPSGAGESSEVCYYANQYCVESESVCANGQVVGGNTCSAYLYSKGCSTEGGAPGYGGSGGSGGGGGTGGSNPGSSTLPDLCSPGVLCRLLSAIPGM